MTVPFGPSVATSAVFVMPTCGCGVPLTVLEHGGLLFPGVQMLPFGGIAVAVLLTSAGGLALTVAVIVYVTKLPGGNIVIVSLMSPLPPAAQLAPALAAQVQVCDAMPAGIGSLTLVPSAGTGPVLVTVTV